MSTEDSNRVTRYLLQRQPAHALVALESAISHVPSNPIYSRHAPAREDASVPATIALWTTYSPALLALLKLSLTVYASLGHAVTREELLDELDRMVSVGGPDTPTANQVAAVRHVATLIRSHSEDAGAIDQPAGGPGEIISVAYQKCQEQLDPAAASPWPPSLIRTLLLAALKLDASSPQTRRSISSRSGRRIDSSAGVEARRVVEDWLAQLDDDVFVYWVNSAGGNRRSSKSTVAAPSRDLAASTSSTDSAVTQGAPAELDRFRKDYLAVIELYLLEILPRQGDWDLANEFLREEAVLGAKGKERLFRKLHAIKQKYEQTTIKQPQTNARSDTPVSVESTTTTRTTASGGGDGQGTACGSPTRSRRSSVDTESTVKPIGSGTIGRRSAATAAVRQGGGGHAQQQQQGPSDRQSRYASASYDVGDLRGRGSSAQFAEMEEQQHVNSEVRRLDERSQAGIHRLTDTSSRTSETSRKVGNFALLRRRLNDYLDEPIHQAPPSPSTIATATSTSSHSNRGRRHSPPPPLPRRADLLTSLTTHIHDRWKSLLTIAFLFYLIARAGRRGILTKTRADVASLTSASTAWLLRFYKAMLDPRFYGSLMGQAWTRLMNTIKMGVTITYV